MSFVAEHYATKDVKAKLAQEARREPEPVVADPQV